MTVFKNWRHAIRGIESHEPRLTSLRARLSLPIFTLALTSFKPCFPVQFVQEAEDNKFTEDQDVKGKIKVPVDSGAAKYEESPAKKQKT